MTRLAELLEIARKADMTPEQRKQQTISFVYGNLRIENPLITREIVEQAYEELYDHD